MASFPVPAIVFLCVLVGCIVILCIVYQLLKRDMCCKFDIGTEETQKTPQKNGYMELTQEFYPEETEFATTDDEYLGRMSSKELSRRSSRRSSYDINSRSDGELALGDSASNYGYGHHTASESELSPQPTRKIISATGEPIDIRISGPDEQDFMSQAGKLLLEIHYFATTSKLNVTVIRAAEIPSRARGGASTVQVRLVLLPLKRLRFKTKVRPASNPVFNETFSFHNVDHGSLSQSTLRIRMYGHERASKDRLIGEIEVPLSDSDLAGLSNEEPMWKTLKPRGLTSADSLYDLTDTSSLQSFGSATGFGSSSSITLAHGGSPELLVSLCYTSLTGRLTVEVLKASNLRNFQMQRAPDTYVKVSMFNSVGQQLSKSKTSIRRSMFDPEYNETFVFQIIEFDLPSVSFMFSIINIKKMRRKEILGWFSMGRDNTSEEELLHWKEMLEAKGKTVRKWHVLTAISTVDRGYVDE
ncbi:synaptotagmin-16-like isoform X4 [Rhopilema esculentum]|uniref:synaptotagmin-16-like isoform X4 n=1 Tax=Rhopilema esculentum TaxID=499914 RepID=UPI0031D9FC27